MIKAVIFDVDDTLISTGDETVEGLVEASKKFGIRVPDKREVQRLLGLPWETMVERLWPGIDIDNFTKSYEEFKTIYKSLGCVLGAREVIESVKSEGYFIGIITSRNNNTLDVVMEKCKLSLSMFDYVEANDQNQYSKPDPRVFDNLKKKLAKQKISSKEIVYVGDAIYDYQAARDVGFHFIAFLNGAYTREEFIEEGLNTSMAVESLTDLPGIFKKIKLEVKV